MRKYWEYCIKSVANSGILLYYITKEFRFLFFLGGHFMEFEKVLAKRNNKTIYKNGDKVVKVFNEDFSKADILNEALNMARIEETDLNVPKLYEVTMIDGKWAIVSEYIEGKTLAELMEENPADQDKYLQLFVDTQLNILATKAPANLNKIKDKMHAKISSTRNLIEATVRYDLHTRLAGMKDHYKVCHGDFNPSNLIIRDDGEVYIIDWAHVTQGNASADAARTYLLFKLDDEDELAEQYLNLFCKQSDIAKQLVQQWLPIVAASQMSKGNASDIEKLRNWVEIFDYQ